MSTVMAIRFALADRWRLPRYAWAIGNPSAPRGWRVFRWAHREVLLLGAVIVCISTDAKPKVKKASASQGKNGWAV